MSGYRRTTDRETREELRTRLLDAARAARASAVIDVPGLEPAAERPAWTEPVLRRPTSARRR